MTRARFLALVLIILVGGGVLRTLWLCADPPTTSVGVVWHDEGPWVHNARNMELWGVWQTDNWNPVFIAPVFTALEYAAFHTFGVGTWQARTVPVASGLLALLALMAGLRAVADRFGDRTALIGGAVLAANFTWVMWNRAALMESTMTMFIVVAWAAYALAGRRPFWGMLAGVAATLAFFTKAAAAFFVVAILLDAVWTLATARFARLRRGGSAPSNEDERGAWLTLAGVAGSALIIGALFVWPHWRDYQFYNWQMSVERKPSYGLRDFRDRATWLPVVQDILHHMWLVLLGSMIALAGIAARWRTARPAERLLVLWVVIGFAELILHDSGNERRYVMFIPAFAALAALVAGQGREWLPPSLAGAPTRSRIFAALCVLPLAYLLIGSLIRPLFEGDIALHVFKGAVRTSAVLAVVVTAVVYAFWQNAVGWLSRRRIAFSIAMVLVAVSIGANLWRYVQWARMHTQLNYEASVELGELLAPGTLVQGKLANGLDLENQIKPIFVGRGFGNYEDRLNRDDARYILTISLPEEGRESQRGLIREILDRYPNRRVIATLDIDDTPGRDQAVLIEKLPTSTPAPAGSHRAPD